MKMGRFQASAGLACAVLLSAIGSQPVQAQTAEAEQVTTDDLELRRAIAGEIVDLGIPNSKREALFYSTVDQMTKQMREAAMKNVDASDKGAVAVLDNWFDDWIAQGKVILQAHIPHIMDGWKNAYADIYSVEELTGIRDFVTTPTGAKFFLRQQDILSNPHFAKANQDYMNEIMGKLPAAQRKLMTDLVEYFEKKADSKPD